MGVRSEILEIKGCKYTLNTLGAVEGLEVLAKLLALAGAPIGAVGAGLKGQTLEGGLGGLDVKAETLSAVVGSLLEGLGKVEVAALVQRLTRDLIWQGPDGKGSKVDFNTHFAGNYGELARVVLWALEINFSSFFDEAPFLQGLASRVVGSK